MLRALAWVVIGTVFLTCLISPLIFSALLALFPDFPWPFSRVLDRVAMVVVLLLLIINRRSLSLSGVKDYLIKGPVKWRIRFLLAGAILSLLSGIGLLWVFIEKGRLLFTPNELGFYVKKFTKVIPAAFLIAFLEESFFRAIVFDKIRSSRGVFLAAIISSLLYASVHFLAADRSYKYPGYSWTVGFEYAASLISRLSISEIGPPFLGLFIVGTVLCFALVRTGSLYLCIGLHAGWIVAVKTSVFAAKPLESESLTALGRRYLVVSEPVSWGAILLVGGVIHLAAEYFRSSLGDRAFHDVK